MLCLYGGIVSHKRHDCWANADKAKANEISMTTSLFTSLFY